MKATRIPYIVKEGTKAMTAVNDWKACVETFQKEAGEFCKKHGAKHFWEDGYKLTGLMFDSPNDAPESWRVRKNDPEGFYTPYGPSPEAKAAKEEMAALSQKWSSLDFARRFGGHSTDGRVIVFPSLEFYDDKIVMGIPARLPMPDIIDGCEEILISEYLQIVKASTEGDKDNVQ